jgi:hypothetical protein
MQWLINKLSRQPSRPTRRSAFQPSLEHLEDRLVPAGVPAPVVPGIASAITHSSEHYADFVTGAYQQYLHRTPTPAEVNGWVAAMQNGLTDEQLEACFVGSAESVAGHGGPGAGWVTSLYQDLLHRTPTATEVNGWVAALRNGASPQDVAHGFAVSVEREIMRVQGDYKQFLGRPASAAEIEGWVNAFEHGATNENVVAGFISSCEFQTDHPGTVNDWLAAVYPSVLHRPANAADLQAWDNLLMNDWFGQNLGDPALRDLSRGDFNRDGALTRADMLGLFARAEADGVVSGAELADLQTLVANAGGLAMPDDVGNLAGKVTGDNPANQHFQGGVLGDLYASCSAERLAALADKWFLGGDMPAIDILPPVFGGGPSDTYPAFYMEAAGTLFGPNGTPQFTDVNQGVVGDCYFLAALAEIAHQSPGVLHNSIIDNHDGTFTFRFNRATGDQAPDWDYVTVNRMLPAYFITDAQGNPSGDARFVYNGWNNGQTLNDPSNALWVGLYEKAYVQLAEEGWSRGPNCANAYSVIGGGDPAAVLQQIGGWTANDEAPDGPDVNQVVTQGVANGQWAVLCTPDPEPNPDLVGGHAYAVLGYDANTGMVSIYNPWGTPPQNVALSELQTDFDCLSFVV